jgi:DNA modification methylase
MQRQVIQGDCLEVMRAMEPNSVDAIVCDPPYGLGFMGRDWDHGIPGAAFWQAALRVAKPGAHLVAFGGTRTFHRLASAIEDAGWEIRDTLMWLYGSGFPKSLDVSKAMDKAAGAEREAGGASATSCPDFPEPCSGHIGNGRYSPTVHALPTIPATDLARQWDGWGTALKPAWEPIILARKPLAGTVAATVSQYGTGALNIDGCRIEHDGRGVWGNHGQHPENHVTEPGSNGTTMGAGWHSPGSRRHAAGRWPANVVLSHSTECGIAGCAPDCAAALLDAQSGERGSFVAQRKSARSTPKLGNATYAHMEGPGAGETVGYGDTGGASRFFYTAKASRREREAGLEGMDKEAVPFFQTANGTSGKPSSIAERPQIPRTNNHPTVKPLALMRWLCRLVTPTSVNVLECVDCGHEYQNNSAHLRDVREGVPGQGPREPILFGEMPGGKPDDPQDAVPGVSPDGDAGAGDLLLPGVCGEVREQATDAPAPSLQTLRHGVQAQEGRRAEVLHEGVRGGRQRRGAAKAGRPAEPAGLCPAPGTRSPDGEPRWVRDGASAGDCGALGPGAPTRGSGASQERSEGRQPHREPGTDAEAAPRPAIETPQALQVSALRRDDCAPSCPSCGGSLQLVTRPGKILDPFTGSGSTGCAAVLEGFRFTGIEQSEEYCAIARRRIAHWSKQATPEQPDLEPAA